ncbi:MAG: CHAT domain-containing protein, partial [Blastocatellia bacterium]
LFQRALTIREKSLTPNHPDVASFLSSLALFYAAKGELAQAVSAQLRANAVSEHNIILNLAAGSERQKLAYLDLLSKQSNQSLSLHVQSAPMDQRALRMALLTLFQRKGRSLDAMSNAFAQLRRGTNAQEQALFDQFTDTVSRIANLTFQGPDAKNPAAYIAQRKQLDEQKEKIEAELSKRSAEFQVQIKPVTLESIQAVIPGESALVEIGAYSPVDVKLGKRGNPHYVAYILFPRDEPRWVDLGEAKPVDQAIAAFRQALHDPKIIRVRTLARAVDEKVMRPVRKLLGQTRNILLSPDGALNLVPFAALVDEQNRYLVERYSFTYLTSGRDLLRFRPDVQLAKAPVIVADPDFGEKSADSKAASSTDILDLRQAYFSPLAATAEEAKALKAILPQATVLTRDQATETALKQLASPSVLHIATHGFFLVDQVEDSSEAERRRKLLQQTGDLASLGVRLENPLLRSGLGLAGANLRKSGDDDGILTAMEVAGLNLWGTKLVVLSACETGVGEVRTGEGVYGLRRALVLAGAETQVMSLWPVSDQGTRDLMINYYKALQAGQGRSEAMRQVQLRMLKDPRRRHPFYWASFIVSGEWANLDGRR